MSRTILYVYVYIRKRAMPFFRDTLSLTLLLVNPHALSTPLLQANITGSMSGQMIPYEMMNGDVPSNEVPGGKVKVLPNNHQVRELQTILRDRSTTSGDFVFYADRLVGSFYTRARLTTP